MGARSSTALKARLAVGVMSGIMVPVVTSLAMSSPAGAVQYLCIGPLLSGPGIEQQTFATLNALGAPADVSFTSIQAGFDSQIGPLLYEEICSNIQPLVG
jgi:hypothetical protein